VKFVTLQLGVIVMGALTALAFALFAYLALGVTGLVDRDSGRAILVFLQYLSQLVAGFVAGRLTGASRVLHGSLAALLLLVITVAISVARDPAAALPYFVVLGLIAIVIGAAGGALAEWRHAESVPPLDE
jgi:putative membrane protein (TIGR04086 family)